MAWIESHDNLLDHPKTTRLARALGIEPVCAMGHLHALWHWCLTYAEDGDLGDAGAEDVATAARWRGDPDAFLSALLGCGERAGFLERTPAGGLRVHDWMDYAGRLIQQRERQRQRQRAYRESRAEPESPPATVMRSSRERSRDSNARHAPTVNHDHENHDQNSAPNSRAPAREATATATAGPPARKFSDGDDREEPPDDARDGLPTEQGPTEQELPAARRLLAGLALAEEPAALRAAAAVVAAAPEHNHELRAACCAAWYRAHRRPLTIAAYWRWLEHEPAPAATQPPIARGGPWVAPAVPIDAGPAPAAVPDPPPDPAPAPHAGGVWGDVLDEVAEVMLPANFRRWLAHTQLLERSPGEIVVGVRDAFTAKRIADNFGRAVSVAAADILGEPVTVRYEVLP